MNISLLILDGLLLVIFLVGWIEASGFYAYRWNWWRFLRAASLPLGLGVALHLLVAAPWWENINFRPSFWMQIPVMMGLMAAMIIAPILVINLAAFVVAQFTGSSRVFTVPLGDGGTVFAIPVTEELNPDTDKTKADKTKTDTDKTEHDTSETTKAQANTRASLSKAEYEKWLHKS